MKESYSEGACHTGPESCAGIREGAGEALTGVCAGRILNREKKLNRGADVLQLVRKATSGQLHSAELARTPRGLSPRARTETPRTGTGRSRSPILEIATKVRAVNPRGTTAMYGGEKSDRPILLKKLSNNGCDASRSAERVEGRSLTKGNAFRNPGPGHCAGQACKMRGRHATGRICVALAWGHSPVRYHPR